VFNKEGRTWWGPTSPSVLFLLYRSGSPRRQEGKLQTNRTHTGKQARINLKSFRRDNEGDGNGFSTKVCTGQSRLSGRCPPALVSGSRFQVVSPHHIWWRVMRNWPFPLTMWGTEYEPSTWSTFQTPASRVTTSTVGSGNYYHSILHMTMRYQRLGNDPRVTDLGDDRLSMLSSRRALKDEQHYHWKDKETLRCEVTQLGMWSQGLTSKWLTPTSHPFHLLSSCRGSLLERLLAF
jgi:hypothetical protein